MEKMAQPEEQSQDAITEEEINGTASTPKQPSTIPSRNAFSELMSHKRKPSPTFLSPSKKLTTSAAVQPERAAASNAMYGRNALVEYINHPTSFPASRVISHSSDFVVIHDLYPKSSVHLLLLPRDSSKYLQHPFDAFTDPVFLEKVQQEVSKLKSLAASELRRLYSRCSVADAARNAAMDADTVPETLPVGRDWSKEFLVGVHAHPSMSHLHVHVLSVDRVSECMRHKKHYNSFATPFLVPLEDFPLAKHDVRRHPGREGYLDSDLKCWRCGKNFGRKFGKLKEHLEEELEVWKRL